MKKEKIIDNPKVMQYWDFEENKKEGLDPKKLTIKSNKEAHWTCPNGHKFKRKIFAFTTNFYCRKCNSFLFNFPQFAKYIDNEKNLEEGIDVNNITKSCTTRINLICEHGHHFKQIVCNIVSEEHIYCKKCHSFGFLHPEMLKEWDYEKNKIFPYDIAENSSKKVYFKCFKCGNTYFQKISSHILGQSCPYCSGRKILRGYNDLATKRPDVTKEWNYKKNDKLRPTDVAEKSGKKVGWKCSKCGHEWEAKICSRTKYNTGCPVCNNYSKISYKEKICYFYLKKYFPDAIDNYKPDFLGRKELDIFIPSLKIGVEYDGEAWHQDLLYDLEKDYQCKKNGVKVFHIREPKCPENISSQYLKLENHSKKDLEKQIKKLMKLINPAIKEPDINISRDRSAIYELINKYEVEDSIATDEDLMKFFDFKNNGGLLPGQIKKFSGMVLNWTCPEGHHFQRRVYNFSYMKNKTCPYCKKHITKKRASLN